MTPAEQLFSRIAERRPRLREHVRVYRHRFRGQRWYVLRDATTGRWQRVSSEGWRAVRLLDGRQPLSAVLAAGAGAASPLVEADLVRIIESLQQAELLDWEVAEDAQTLHARAHAVRKRKRLAQWLSPLSMRVPALDPDRFLDRYAGLARQVFSMPGLLLAAAILAAGAAAAVVDWSALTGYWSARGLAAHGVILIPLVYLVMKTVHELAHALAIKRWGGEVHEMGIVLLLLMPIPYVDASAAWGFTHKHRRILVGAAGILAELVLAALAMLLFLCVEPGIVKDFAFTAVLLGSVSTLLFNGNPLLRFDGYYVLSDAIEIPNLGPRASQYWAWLIQRYALGIAAARAPLTAAGERVWLVAYGLLATLYRIGIVLTIAVFVAGVVPVLGVALAVWVLVGQIGWPLLRGAGFIARAPQLAGRRRRALAAVLAVLLVGGTLVAAVPVPLTTRAEGVVWLPERGQVRAGADGIVTALLHEPSGEIHAGAAFARIEDPLLDARIAALEWELKEARGRRDAAQVRDRVQFQVLDETIARIQTDLDTLRGQAQELIVTSPAGGRLVVPDANALLGRFVHKGDVVAYVLEPGEPTVRVAIPQANVGRVRDGVSAVHVRLVWEPGATLVGEIRHQVPAATRTLPSAALGALGGGRIAVDPNDAGGQAAMERVFVVDVVLRDQPPQERIGGRALVRFEHGSEPLAARIAHALRQLFLARLAV